MSETVQKKKQRSTKGLNGESLSKKAQALRNQKAIDLVTSWMNEDSDYDAKAWPIMKRAIESNRLSRRKRFAR